MSKISNTVLLNTRPANQAGALTQKLQQQGVMVAESPALQIVPTDWLATHAADAKQVWQVADKVIFISRNAVKQLVQASGEWLDWQSTDTAPKGFAIGEATRRAMQEYGIATQMTAGQQFDSEALLATDAMQNVQGETIILVKGEGGRDTLAEQLKKSGATVIEWPLYRREKAPQNHQAWCFFADKMAQGKQGVLLATSLQAWHAWTEQYHAWQADHPSTDWSNLPVIVFSERIRQGIEQQAWQGRIHVVPQQSDAGIVSALQQIQLSYA